MRIWVDADACPRVVKEILFRAAERLRVSLVLVANQPVVVPRSPHIRALCVSAGFDAADNRIVRELERTSPWPPRCSRRAATSSARVGSGTLATTSAIDW